jgi:hypothetical protein
VDRTLCYAKCVRWLLMPRVVVAVVATAVPWAASRIALVTPTWRQIVGQSLARRESGRVVHTVGGLVGGRIRPYLGLFVVFNQSTRYIYRDLACVPFALPVPVDQISSTAMYN